MWLTIEEVMSLGVSRRTVFDKISSGDWVSKEAGRGRNGKPVREIQLESLPAQLQFKWAQVNRAIEDEGTNTVEIDISENTVSNEVKLTQALLRFEKEVVREAFLAEAERLMDIVRRYDAINPKRIKNADTGKHDFVPEVLRLCIEAICKCPIVSAIEKHRAKAISPLTLDGWSRKAKIVGLVAFLRAAPQPAVNDGRRAEVSADAEKWIEENWRRFASPRKMYDSLEKLAKKKRWKIPSESTLYRLWSKLPEIVKAKLKSEDLYQSKFAPYVPRDFSDLEALQVLCGDHSVRDVSLILPDGTLARPWLTLWLCLRTYLIWGWHLGLTPSSLTIGHAYANGVRTFGAQPLSRPVQDFYSYLYTDQGKAYRCQTFEGKWLEFKNAAKIEGGLKVLTTQRRVGFFDETGIKQLLARGYNAKEKPVERVHRDISDWEENHFAVEFCGRDAKNKPERWVENWHRHEKLRKKFKNNLTALVQESPFMTLDDYRENLAGWIQEHNSKQHTRTTLGGAKIVPLDEYNRLYTTRYEISEDALSLLLMKSDRKKIGKNGVNMFQPHWNFLHEAMWEFKGEQIEVRYTDEDYTRVWAILPNGQIVEAVNVTPTSLLNLNKQTVAMIQRQKAVERQQIRDFNFLSQSIRRGETVEDRVAQMVNPEEEIEQIQMPIAAAGGGGGATVHQFSRFNAPKLHAVKPRTITTEHISSVTTDNSIFDETPARPRRVREEWETDD